MRRVALCCVTTAGLCLGLATATGPATGATPRQNEPAVAIGRVAVSWDRVDVDYGIADGSQVELDVSTPDGQVEQADRGRGVSGTLTWDRTVDGKNAPRGLYTFRVFALGSGGVGSASRQVIIGFLFAHSPTVKSSAMTLRYELSFPAKVELLLRLKNGTSTPVARRDGHRGHNTIAWDYRRNGKRVKPGKYQLQLVATTSEGQTARVAITGGRRG